MKRHGRLELGAKTIAQKVAFAFRKKPSHFQELVRAEIAQRVHAVRLQVASNDEGFDDADDQHEHARYLSTFPALNGIVALAGQLPGVPTIGDPIDAVEEAYQPGGPPMSCCATSRTSPTTCSSNSFVPSWESWPPRPRLPP